MPSATPVEFQFVVYGEEETVAMLVPSTSNCTFAMVPPDSEAVAVKMTVPAMVALLEGAVSDTLGAVTGEVVATTALVCAELLPEVSTASTV